MLRTKLTYIVFVCKTTSLTRNFRVTILPVLLPTPEETPMSIWTPRPWNPMGNSCKRTTDQRRRCVIACPSSRAHPIKRSPLPPLRPLENGIGLPTHPSVYPPPLHHTYPLPKFPARASAYLPSKPLLFIQVSSAHQFHAPPIHQPLQTTTSRPHTSNSAYQRSYSQPLAVDGGEDDVYGDASELAVTADMARIPSHRPPPSDRIPMYVGVGLMIWLCRVW